MTKTDQKSEGCGRCETPCKRPWCPFTTDSSQEERGENQTELFGERDSERKELN